jgi:hypothetical protein
MNKVLDTGINFWDEVMIFTLFVGVIILFVSAFLIDAHPFFVIVYIMFSFITILIAPSALESIGSIYDKSYFSTEVTKLVYFDFIRQNVGLFLVILMCLTGIIIFGKVVFFRNETTGGRY